MSQRTVVAILACSALAGCDLGAGPVQPHVTMPAAWSEPVSQASGSADVWPAPDWWRSFQSSELDALIAEARTDNLDLAAAAARVLQAEAQLRVAGASLLPHLDLDASPSGTQDPWAPLLATGCRLSLSARTGRPGAERLRAAIDVPGGTYDLILEYDGEARVAVDGGAPARHGSELAAGPRASAWTIVLPAGRHDLEISIATQSGRAELSLLVSPRAIRDVEVALAQRATIAEETTVLAEPDMLDVSRPATVTTLDRRRIHDLAKRLLEHRRPVGRRLLQPLIGKVERDDVDAA